MLTTCSAVFFLVSVCAFWLGQSGLLDVRRLADRKATDSTARLISCSSDDFGSSPSEVPPESPVQSDASEDSFDERQSPRRPQALNYGFPLIDGEEVDLQKTCSVKLGNFAVNVEARELRKHFRWPHKQDIRNASKKLEEYIIRTREELRLEKLSNGFLIKEEDREGRGGRIQVFVDVAWAVWPPLAEDLPREDEASGAAGLSGVENSHQQPQASDILQEVADAASSSVSTNSPQQQNPLDADQEKLPEPPVEVVRHRPSGSLPYMFPRIPGDDNQRTLENLMKTFYATRWPHRGKSSTRYLLEIGDLYISVEMDEVVSRPPLRLFQLEVTQRSKEPSI
ncbi:hypothetical protein Emed_005809 [Eimeria media]